MKLSKNYKTSKKGFTLVELLVVIAILATLGGLSYGPIMKHLRTADVAKAKKVCKDLTFAIGGFEQEYDSLPYVGTYPTDDELYKTDTAAFLDVLMGKNTDINDRAKEFFKADEAQGQKDGLVYTGLNVTKLTDKWGNPYHIMLDFSGDGIINAKDIGGGIPVTGISYKDNLHVDSAIAASPTNDGLFNDEQDAKSW